MPNHFNLVSQEKNVNGFSSLAEDNGFLSYEKIYKVFIIPSKFRFKGRFFFFGT